jgi:hypothetical protein
MIVVAEARGQSERLHTSRSQQMSFSVYATCHIEIYEHWKVLYVTFLIPVIPLSSRRQSHLQKDNLSLEGLLPFHVCY